MNILISPFARFLRNGEQNAKNYPYWKEVINSLKEQGHTITQIGVDGEKAFKKVDKVFFSQPLQKIKQLVLECNLWISVDTFLPHLAHHLNKSGIVIWSVSDPIVFGYKENINLLKDTKYLRKNQFDNWEAQEYNEDAFVKPEVVIKAVEEWSINNGTTS